MQQRQAQVVLTIPLPGSWHDHMRVYHSVSLVRAAVDNPCVHTLTSLCVSWLSGSSNACIVECPPAARVVASKDDSTVLVPADGPAGGIAKGFKAGRCCTTWRHQLNVVVAVV